MIADVIDALDRRYRLLERRLNLEDAGQVLPEVAAFMEFLENEPRLRVLCEDMLGEAAAGAQRFRRLDEALVEEVVVLRAHMATAHPPTDDSTMALPGPNDEPIAYECSYAYFDRLRHEVEPGMPPTRLPLATGKAGKAAQLMGILSGKANAIQAAGEWTKALQEEMWTVHGRIEHVHRQWATYNRTSPACAFLRLAGAAGFLSAPPPSVTPGRGPDFFWSLLQEDFHPLAGLRAVALGRDLRAEREWDEEVLRGLRVEADRLYEDLRARLGSARSQRGLLERFRLRAQLYDAVELRRAGKGRRGENALTERLARFLFDAGLNPLTRPLVGRLEPDLLDTSSPWSLYVEAKRYGAQRNARRYLRDGIEQVCDTLSNLQGHPRAVREAFYVVFRLGGPRYELPEEVRRDGVVIHPILIDIAPNQERGSRRKTRTIRIPVEEWMPADDS